MPPVFIEMGIEDEVFAMYFADEKKLKKYGFIDTERGLSYSFDLIEGEFEATVTVDNGGKVKGKIVDKESGEEYVAVHVDTFVGGFVGSVRAKYREKLESIRDACFSRGRFLSPQTGAIADYVYEKYGEISDHPFEEDGLFVFRRADNKKWYALVMPIKKNKLFGEDQSVVEVVNLKIDTSKRESLLKIDGIYPAYHMNKKLWVSVLLDGTVDKSKIFGLIDRSRDLVGAKKPLKKKSGYKSIIGKF